VEGTGTLLKTHRYECRWGHAIQTAVRPIVIVIYPPAICNISEFIEVQGVFFGQLLLPVASLKWLNANGLAARHCCHPHHFTPSIEDDANKKFP